MRRLSLRNVWRAGPQGHLLVERLAARLLPPHKEGNLADRVRSSGQGYVGFDIFDTLVARAVAPEHVKLLAADRLCRVLGWSAFDARKLYEERRAAEKALCLRSWHASQELEFRFAELAGTLLERLASKYWPVSCVDIARFQETMIDCELAAERSVLRPVDSAIKIVNLARTIGKRVVFISDHYLTSQQIALLIEPFNILQPHDALFVSSDHMASKRSGGLYEVVCRTLGISPSALLMIGDNRYSDCMQARRLGSQAIQVRDPARVAYYRSRLASVTHRRPRQDAFQDVLATSTLSDSRNFRALVPSLFVFTEKLYAAARRNGIKDLHFLAREGQPLMAMFNIYQDSLGCVAPDRIRTHYLLASRLSCYAASLRPLEKETFDGILRFYPHLSLGGFLQSLGLERQDVEGLAAEISANPDETVNDFANSAALSDLRRSSSFQRLYDCHRLTQRILLRAYIDKFGVGHDGHPLALVDIGWKGSIQDYLRAALPSDIRIQGYYFGLVDIGQPVDDKLGLMFTNVPTKSRYYRTYSENHTVFELLLCADHGSARQYEANDDGSIKVLLDNDDSEHEYISVEWLPARNDLLQAFREFCQARNRFCVSLSDMERFAARAHARLVFQPWQANAQALVGARHRENFALFSVTGQATQAPLTLRSRCGFLLRLASNPRATLGTSSWPASTLQHYLGRPVAGLYAIGRHLQDRLASKRPRRHRRGIG